MNKDLHAEDTLELASRIRRFGIIPEFSIIFGNPKDPEGDTRDCINFIRQLKRLNPDSEIVVEHYTPSPSEPRCMAESKVTLNSRKRLTNGRPSRGNASQHKKTQNSVAKAEDETAHRQL